MQNVGKKDQIPLNQQISSKGMKLGHINQNSLHRIYNNLIIVLLMTSTRHQQPKNIKNSRSNHQQLFCTHEAADRNQEFLEIYQKFKKESEQTAKISNRQENIKKISSNQAKPEAPYHQKKSPSIKNNFKNHDDLDLCTNKKEVPNGIESRRPRAASSDKLDSLPKRDNLKKKNKFMQYLLQNTKKNDFKETSSRKSTDNQSSVQIAKMKKENERFMELIQKQIRKEHQLEHQIVQESKKHEIQKHLYHYNIEKLRKKLSEDTEKSSLHQINELQESFLSNNQEQQFKTLSIQSN